MKPLCNPYQVVKDFENAVAEYTGAPHCVAVNSCTMALQLACAWQLWGKAGEPMAPPATLAIEIPKRTYVSVPMAILHAGALVNFRDEDWHGAYKLEPLEIWDSARRFRQGMYKWSMRWDYPRGDQHSPALHDGMVCVSFHWSKILGIQQGGAILLSDPEAADWLRRARFDGRTEGVRPAADNFTFIGSHCYMSPEIAAEGLVRLHFLPDDNPDLPNDDYPDLSLMEIFR